MVTVVSGVTSYSEWGSHKKTLAILIGKPCADVLFVLDFFSSMKKIMQFSNFFLEKQPQKLK